MVPVVAVVVVVVVVAVLVAVVCRGNVNLTRVVQLSACLSMCSEVT